MNSKRSSQGFSFGEVLPASVPMFGFTQPSIGSMFLADSGRVLPGSSNNSGQVANKPPMQDDSLLQIVHDLEGLMKDEELSDFTFAVDGQNFKVHKAILAGWSIVKFYSFR